MGSDRETEREGWGGGYISYPSNSLLSPSRKRLPRMLRDTDINIIIIIIIIPVVPAPAAIDLFLKKVNISKITERGKVVIYFQ